MKARRSPLAALLAAFAAAACGCTSETTSSSTTGDAATTTSVVFDAKMLVVSPDDGGCVPIPDGPNASIPLTLAFKTAKGSDANVYLRPARFCIPISGSLCGHVLVRAAGSSDDAGGSSGGVRDPDLDPLNNEGTTSTVSVLLGRFNDPYQDYRITVELVDDADRAILVAPSAGEIDAAVPLRQSLTVRARKSCK